MNRRSFLIAAAAAAAAAAPAKAFDGRSLTLAGREHVLSDIIAPAVRLSGGKEPASDFASITLNEIIRQGAPLGSTLTKTDRWGRLEGAIGWRTREGRATTLQEILLAEGAARVAPETDDLEFIERCFASERAAREARLGLWAFDAWRIRDAAKAEWSRGYQIYAGVIRAVSEHGGRIFFNFGGDFRTDFTATVSKGVFRRWAEQPDLLSVAGMRVEVRGLVEAINGPSIELLHEMQMRMV